MSEYQFDIYVKAPGKRGRHVRFVARLSRKVAEAVLAGIYAAVDANGEDAGGGFAEVPPETKPKHKRRKYIRADEKAMRW